MDFEDSPEDARFRSEVRSWLESNAEPLGSSPGTRVAPKIDAKFVQHARAWQQKKAQAGFACITWPKEYGGAAGTPIQDVIFKQEESKFRTPRGVLEIGLGMCVPTILVHGTPKQKDRFVRHAVTGQHIWSQLFSEPGAGSDLAGIRTRAVKTNEGWLLAGQKVWTSGAHYSDYGLILTRTDLEQAKHKGLTMFIVDMRSKGIDIRPIKQMTGESDFNEVFFEDVFVPDENRVGDVNDGWKIAITTLMNERLSVGPNLRFLTVDDVRDIAVASKRLFGSNPAGDSTIGHRLAFWHLNAMGLELLSRRAQTAIAKGGIPGPELSVSKLIAATQGQEMGNFAIDLMGMGGILTHQELGDDWRMVERSWAWGAAMRIAGGTDEILRNIIAERVLGLPAEHRSDKDVAFGALE